MNTLLGLILCAQFSAHAAQAKWSKQQGPATLKVDNSLAHVHPAALPPRPCLFVEILGARVTYSAQKGREPKHLALVGVVGFGSDQHLKRNVQLSFSSPFVILLEALICRGQQKTKTSILPFQHPQKGDTLKTTFLSFGWLLSS